MDLCPDWKSFRNESETIKWAKKLAKLSCRVLSENWRIKVIYLSVQNLMQKVQPGIAIYGHYYSRAAGLQNPENLRHHFFRINGEVK